MKTEKKPNEINFNIEIQEIFNKSFKNILTNNSSEDLDIDNKNISIDSQNIENFDTEFNDKKYQTPIFNQQKNIIGYFALIISKENEIIDEYFVIDS